MVKSGTKPKLMILRWIFVISRYRLRHDHISINKSLRKLRRKVKAFPYITAHEYANVRIRTWISNMSSARFHHSHLSLSFPNKFSSDFYLHYLKAQLGVKKGYHNKIQLPRERIYITLASFLVHFETFLPYFSDTKRKMSLKDLSFLQKDKHIEKIF